MNVMYVISLMCYFSGFLMFCFGRKHFLILLLSLELITLSIFLNMFIMFSFLSSNLFFLMIFLTMAVCEGVLGLSIMVMVIRSIGNEFFMSLNSLW